MALAARSSHLRPLLLAAGATLGALLIGWGGVKILRREPRLQDVLASPTLPSPPTAPALDLLRDVPIDLPDTERDSDLDGLPDALEALYRTDPETSDTDGDGYRDGTEVANGYDPTIPSPNDKIAARPSPAPSPQPPAPTFTQQFLGQTGKPLTKESLLGSRAELQSFIRETNARGILPEVPDSDIRRTTARGKTAIATYLDAISPRQNPTLRPVDAAAITSAFATLTQEKNPAPLEKVTADLQNNVDVLRAAPVPTEAVELHRQYLAATRALLENTERLRGYQQDYVGALVAASRLEQLRSVFQEIAAGIKALEKKYTIT